LPHEAEQPLEHVEHAKHASLDPFDRRVAMTMAIVAAILAAVILLSHRAHTNTILQSTKAADQWGYYQAKKGREHIYDAMAELLSSSASVSPEAAKASIAKWRNKSERYKAEAEEIKERAESFEHESEASHHRANWFDSGELGVELAIILCSIAVLTKRSTFWLSGMVFGALGTVVALLGLVFH
jgi:hypothetical protein